MVIFCIHICKFTCNGYVIRHPPLQQQLKKLQNTPEKRPKMECRKYRYGINIIASVMMILLFLRPTLVCMFYHIVSFTHYLRILTFFRSICRNNI